MKKYLALFLVLVLSLSVTAALAEETIQMDKLTFQFVPSKDADVIITDHRHAESARTGAGRNAQTRL
ncbi:MAG: hypothetical protein UFE80_00950 [Christensenellales bacterium]|nr:hypothetical protein [Christensenellales bacterium]